MTATDIAEAPPRQSPHPVESFILERWSSRAFTGAAVAEADLRTCFEAARWAPSAFNAQPWRFVYAHRDRPEWDALLALLNTRNRQWAYRAGALVFVASRTDFDYGGERIRIDSHAFDTGAAWALFALQAQALGYATRAMGGFDRAAAPDVLGLPGHYRVEAAVAIGRRGDPARLPDDLRAQERPSGRRPLDALVFEGRFRAEADA